MPGGLHRGRACDRGSDGPLGSMSVIQTFWFRKRAHLCLVLNEVQLGCSDVSEDSLLSPGHSTERSAGPLGCPPACSG